jgi:hypothetical protein
MRANRCIVPLVDVQLGVVTTSSCSELPIPAFSAMSVIRRGVADTYDWQDNNAIAASADLT